VPEEAGAERRAPLLLLDSASLYFRAYFGVPESTTAPDGMPVNAVRGFLDMIATLVRRVRPGGLVCCWDDDWRPAWRVELIPSYKAHRVAEPATGAEEVPDTLSPQVPVIADVLAALGIARIGAPGYEADDVIGTLATQSAHPVVIVTGDRDLFQLVDDARSVRVLYTGKGVAKADEVDEAWLRAKYGVDGPGYADLAVLRGDPSDGLPGVPGIGEKTAAALLRRWGSLEDLLAALDAGDPAVAKRPALEAARGYLEAAGPVVRVARDLDLPDADPALPTAPADPDRLVDLIERYGLRTSVARLQAAVDAVG
jgi:5'-3' exonuclease